MLITCPKCTTSYQVDPSSLSPTGGSVHCARCEHSWFAANTAAIAAIEQAYRAEIAEFSCTLARPSTGTEVVQVIKAIAATHAPVEAVENGNSDEEVSGNRITPGEASSGAAIGHYLVPAKQAGITASASVASGDRGPGASQLVVRAQEDVPRAAVYGKGSARRQGRWTSLGAGAVIPSLIAANLALIGWRADLVRLLPQTASLYGALGLPVNVRGVAFAEFSVKTDRQEARPALAIDGSLLNITQRVVRLTGLRFSLRDEKGRVVYGWTEPPPKRSLAPGEALPFGSRLPSPPDRGKELVVRFLGAEESYSAAMKLPLSAVATTR
jgi:predicted Zn finger-like uncharacterized protein